MLPVRGVFCNERLTVRRLVNESSRMLKGVGQISLSICGWWRQQRGRTMLKIQELCRVIQRNKKLIASKFCQCSTHGPSGVSLRELDWGGRWPSVKDFLVGTCM
jgi:hypothetical protein